MGPKRRQVASQRRYPLISWLMIFAFLVPLATPTLLPHPVEAQMVQPVPIDPPPQSPANGTGLALTLSEGSQQITTTQPITVGSGTPLAEDETAALLDRLPPLTTTITDVQDFRLPEQTLPPPQPGVTVEATFPPSQTQAVSPTVESGALEVIRYSPEGEITIAPFLNVTFNQPMVPLATLDQLSSAEVPVRITPELPGVWKWIGSKTLSFEYQSDELAIDRFPKATVYTVEIPVGTRSATGGELAESVVFTFTTPAPRLEYTFPVGGPQPVDPLLFIRFDQAIDPAAVLETIQVTAGGETFPIRLANQTELAASRQIQGFIRASDEARWIAFRSETPFPNDTTVTINVGPGTPSAEGPLTTSEVQSYSFTTFAPLRVAEAYCGWGGECPPLSPFYVRFNNPLDANAFDPALVTVSPEIPGMRVNVLGDRLEISGETQGRTTYNVTIAAALRDIFGQTLGQDETHSFTTGPAQRYLAGPNRNFITLDPSASQPSLSLYTVNYERLRLRIYQVTPEDWPAYLRWQNEESYKENPVAPPGQEVFAEQISIEAAEDTLVETKLDLNPYLNEGLGHVIVWVDVPRGLLGSLFGNRDYNRVITWVQSTQIGLDVLADRDQLYAWATALTDGTPLADLPLALSGTDLTATTDAQGMARFDLTNQAAYALVAHQGNDVAFLPNNIYYYGSPDSGWHKIPSQDYLRWYLFDDRHLYRPGEEVHIKGWVRGFEDRADGDIVLVGDAIDTLHYIVSDPQGNQIADGAIEVNNLGGFDFNFTLPENVNLGYANIYLTARNAGPYAATETYYGIQIQEFRTPEFSVTARNEEQGPFFVGDAAVVAVAAQYFAGGPLPNAETNWQVTASPSSYSPPNWPDFTFGRWTPWWAAGGDLFREAAYFPYGTSQANSFSYTGRTDASGTHYLRMTFDSISDVRPYSVLAEGRVMDVNRQAWAASTSLLVHPSSYYVGLRSERYFVEQGEALEIEAIVTDLDGNALAGVPITVTAARLEWKFDRGRWQQVESEPQTCTIDSALEPVTCAFSTELGGDYRIVATVQDHEGRPNLTQLDRWVGGGRRPAAQTVTQESVTLIPNQEAYQPGDTAQILVQSPFSPAEGLATISRGGILYTERFVIEDGTYTLEIPIEEAHIPNLTVQVDLNGAAARTDVEGNVIDDVPFRPAYASGRLDLTIPPLSRTLKVEITPEATALAPGEATALDLLVLDANGEPQADAELAVVVVDEAILALSNYTLADPIAVFYETRYSQVDPVYGRSSIVLVDPTQLLDGAAGGGVGRASMEMQAAADMAVPAAAPMATAEMAVDADFMAKDAEEAQAGSSDEGPITIRTNFNPLALFAPDTRTDEEGRARIEFTLPDNLTRYRLMVVAVAGDNRFGMAEANLTARLPLMVRPSAPRFLNFGDRFELPIVLQNQTDEAMDVRVALRANNLQAPISSSLAISGNPGMDLLTLGQLITVPANDRIEVRFPVQTANAGTVRLQVAASATGAADAAELSLPVYTPATSEAFAVYGVVDEGAIAQPLQTPSNVFPQFGGLEINTSSTALQALTDAVIYLTNYPFECSEQLASRILGVAALRDVLSAFDAEGLPSPEELNAAVARDITRLQALQNSDGGWPIWSRGDESAPYYTIHVAHALQRARMKDYAVSDETLSRVLSYLRNIEQYYPDYYSETTRHSLSAYAVYVRDLMGDTDPSKARALLAEYPLEEQSLEAVAWIWQVLSGDEASSAEVAAIRQHINNRAVETAGAANFTTSYGEQAYLLLHSDRRTDGIILDALINDQPESDLIPKVVNGLLANQTAGRWNNTQENAFILLALDRYFSTFEGQTPDFVARVWLGDTYAAEHTYAGRTTERYQTLIPMDYLVASDEALQDLIISKDGDGRLYYRLGLRYAPSDLDMPPVDQGFVVQRRYEPVDSPDDVVLDEQGIWRIKAGARVRVRISMVADNRRYHVALVDPLPAGLEILNPALATTERLPADPNARRDGWWWWRQWYEHQNLRDDRAEAFTTLLWDGVYEYSYVARATTPGEFVVPPAKAEEMYSPEVFGRGAVDRVIIE